MNVNLYILFSPLVAIKDWKDYMTLPHVTLQVGHCLKIIQPKNPDLSYAKLKSCCILKSLVYYFFCPVMKFTGWLQKMGYDRIRIRKTDKNYHKTYPAPADIAEKVLFVTSGIRNRISTFFMWSFLSLQIQILGALFSRDFVLESLTLGFPISDTKQYRCQVKIYYYQRYNKICHYQL